MKPQTAARKLGVFLPATPEEFRAGAITPDELARLEQNPPEWLRALRDNGPHPRDEVARRLGITIAGLRRHGFADQALTTQQIDEFNAQPPEWLLDERARVKAEGDSARTT